VEMERVMLTLEALMRDYPQHMNYKWLYVNDWYDGPISGMIETTPGHQLYAKLKEELDEGERIYSLTKLDNESAVYEAQKHADFVKYVGDHWSFVPGGERGTVKPASEHRKFYDKYPWNDRETLTGKIVGWIK
jgi:hypothetical protein